MFDSIRIGGGDSHHRHEINEKRAPTDESVRLLREMEEAAEKNVLCRGKLDDNSLMDARWVIFHNSLDDKVEGRVRFKLNGREFLIDVPISGNLSIRHTGPPREFVMAVHQKIIEKVSEHLTLALVDNKDFRNTLR